MSRYLKHVAGFVGLSAMALACSVSMQPDGTAAPGAVSLESAGGSSSGIVVGGSSSGVLTVSTPEVLPSEYWTAVIDPAADGDLAHYFPSAPASASGGWSTGTCSDPFCLTDEYFSEWVGPSVPSLGSYCVAAQAQEWAYSHFVGRFFRYLTPYSPASRAAGVIPTEEYCVCGPQLLGEPPPQCWEPAYVYVMCPYTSDSNLNGFVSQNRFGVQGLRATTYFTFTEGATIGAADGSTPSLTSNAVIYEIDPQCGSCATNGPPCN
jgi:hypothetical protein